MPPPDENDTTAPRSWQQLCARYPAVADGYASLAEASRAAGPLDGREVALAKLAISVGGAAERTVHAHAKKALRLGIAPDALRQVALIALPTIGLPATLDALHWIDESIEEFDRAGR